MAIADNDNIASQKHSPFSVVVFIKYRACLRNTVLIVKDSFGKGTNRCTLRYLYQSRLFANRREHATTASLHSLHHHGTFLVIHVHTHMVHTYCPCMCLEGTPAWHHIATSLHYCVITFRAWVGYPQLRRTRTIIDNEIHVSHTTTTTTTTFRCLPITLTVCQ